MNKAHACSNFYWSHTRNHSLLSLYLLTVKLNKDEGRRTCVFFIKWWLSPFRSDTHTLGADDVETRSSPQPLESKAKRCGLPSLRLGTGNNGKHVGVFDDCVYTEPSWGSWFGSVEDKQFVTSQTVSISTQTNWCHPLNFNHHCGVQKWGEHHKATV